MSEEQKEADIAALQDKVSSLTLQLEAVLQANAERGSQKRRLQAQTHTTNVREVQVKGKSVLVSSRERMGRTASICTQQALDLIPDDGILNQPGFVQRILEMFEQPSAHVDYLNSIQFAKDVFKLCQKVRHIFEREPRVAFVQSPAYVFGDIHGNLEDLHFFSDNLWRLGMSLTAGNFVFLGDYVDRGKSCLECIAYLFVMKYQLPNKVFLLRGNHETRDVNGWEEHYGERSFIFQCRNRFGDDVGYRVWEACNQIFDRLPLAGVIDQDVFCVHGGIPRPISNATRIQDMLSVPRVAGINPPYEHEDDQYQQVASDCIWSDPASEEQESTVDPESGFGESLRGGGAICFGNKAVAHFLKEQGFSYIMRAHEAHAEGVSLSKGARVFTVFSTSQDHNQGSNAMAGCMLVDNDKLQVINRSPAYKNQYVHRRDSVSVSNLSAAEMEKRLKLGLIRDAPPPEDSDEEWDDFDDDEEEEDMDLNVQQDEYVFDKRRRQSIDLNSMTSNMHDLSADMSASANMGMTAVEEEEEEDTIDGDSDMK